MSRSSSRRPMIAAALLATAAVALAGPAAAHAVPAAEVVASHPAGSVDAFAGGYGYAAWSVSGRRAGGTALSVRDPQGEIRTLRLRRGTILDLRVVRGPARFGVRDVAVVGMRCRDGERPPSRRCVPFGTLASGSPTPWIPGWAYPAFGEHRRAMAFDRAIEDGRTVALTPLPPGPAGEGADGCAVTIRDDAGERALPAVAGCRRIDVLELRGRTVLAYGIADLRECGTCTQGPLRALDLGDPGAGWKTLARYEDDDAPAEPRGVVSAVAVEGGAIGLTGGPSVGVAADDPQQPVTLRRWRLADARAAPPVRDPRGLLSPRRTVHWEQVVSTRRELLALTTDRVTSRRGAAGGVRSIIARVPIDLGDARDPGAPRNERAPGAGVDVVAEHVGTGSWVDFGPFDELAAGYGQVAWARQEPAPARSDRPPAILSVRGPGGQLIASRREPIDDLRMARLLAPSGVPQVGPIFSECVHERCDGDELTVPAASVPGGRRFLTRYEAVEDDLATTFALRTPGGAGTTACEVGLDRLSRPERIALPTIPRCSGLLAAAIRGPLVFVQTRFAGGTERTVQSLQVLDRSASQPRWTTLATPGEGGFGAKMLPSLTGSFLYTLHHSSYRWTADGPVGQGPPQLSRYDLRGLGSGQVPVRQTLAMPTGLGEQLTALAGDDDAVYAIRTFRQLVPGRPDQNVSQVLRFAWAP